MQGVRTHVFLNIPEDGEQQQQEELDRRVAFGSQARLVWNVPAGEFTAGVSARLDESRYDRYDTELRQRTDTAILNDGSYLSGSLFGRWRRTLAGKWILDLGTRLDAIQYGSLDRLVAGSTTRAPPPCR